MDILLDANGDLSVSAAGELSLTSGVAETAKQELWIELRTFLGEWFLDTTVGVPFYRDVLIKNPNLALLRTLFIQKIQANQYVESVLSINLDWDRGTRSLTVDFDARLIDDGLISLSLSTAVETEEAAISDPFPILF
jgi:hypothetical protein